jgi:hypothetical protein
MEEMAKNTWSVRPISHQGVGMDVTISCAGNKTIYFYAGIFL